MHRDGVLHALGLAIALAASSRVAAQDTPAFGGAEREGVDVQPSRLPRGVAHQASSKLLELQNEIRREREKIEQDRTEQLKRIRDLRAEKRYLERTLETLREEAAERAQEKEEKRKVLEEEETARKELEKPSEALLASMRAYVDEVAKLIETGIPWKLDERKDVVGKVRGFTTGEEAVPSSALAAVGRVQQEEESLGRLTESATVSLEIGDETVAVEAFHLGLLAVIFADEEGKIIGFAQPGETLEEGLNAALADEDAAEGYLAAVDILRRRRTPSIIELHLPALPVREEAPRGEEER